LKRASTIATILHQLALLLAALSINEKLKELIPIDWAKTQELIVKELNLNLTKSRGGRRNISEKDAAAGKRAGEHATFNRPVGAGGGRYLK
jgi:hypothetical protein